MIYVQIAAGQKLHLAYEPGEGPDDFHLVKAGQLSMPLCNRSVPAHGYRMNINLPLGHACMNCQRIYKVRKA